MPASPFPELIRLARLELNGYSDAAQADKDAFHRIGRRAAHHLASCLSLPRGSYDVRSNPAGIAGSGEVTLHTDTLYVQFGQGSFHDRFMFRSCRGRRDYRGGRNQWMNWEELADPAALETFRATAAAYVPFDGCLVA